MRRRALLRRIPRSWRLELLPAWRRDINADGIGEFLVTNGGDDYADIGDPRHRVARGAQRCRPVVIHRLPVPEAAEIVADAVDTQGVPYVVYGTGGETLPGSLFEVPSRVCSPENLRGRKSCRTVADYGCIVPPAC